VQLVQVSYFQISKTKGNKVFKSLGITGSQRDVVSRHGSTPKMCKFLNANFQCSQMVNFYPQYTVNTVDLHCKLVFTYEMRSDYIMKCSGRIRAFSVSQISL